MASAEEDFPRGGITKRTTDSKKVTSRAQVDNLFQVKEEPKKKKRKGGNKDESQKLKKPKTGETKPSAAGKTVEILHIKNVKEGTLLLGCVKEVADFEVTVGLPCGLQGHLSIRNICDSYTKLLSEQLESDDTEEICSLQQLFHPGMALRCVVAKLDVTKSGLLSIQLSTNPKLVNKSMTPSSLKTGMVLSGCVESVEDHGCIVDIGVSGTKAFLPKDAMKTKPKHLGELRVGQYLTCLVERVKSDGRVVNLSVDPAAVTQACAEPKHGWTLTNLLPGLVVQATVKKVVKHGLLLDFLSSFSGQVNFLHMELEQTATYTEGLQVRACVLYMEPSSHVVELSLRSHLLQPGADISPAPAAGDQVGEVVGGCKMTAMHHMSGAMLEMPDGSPAFVHKNHLRESHETANENRVFAAPEHTCRILDFSPVEQIHFASLRKSVIERQFYRYHDLKTGQLVEGTVAGFLNQGMMVRLSDHIKGLVPHHHLSDITLKNPEKKYTEGMRVKCRVLSVAPDTRKLYLTRKKALVDSTLPLFLSYADARPGMVSHGHIVTVKPFGCIVRFYNEVRGLVPLGELSSEPVVSPEQLFYVGQVLKAKVLRCDPDKEKMLLSFKAALEGDAETAAASPVDCEVGKVLEAKLVKKTPGSLEVSILPEGARAVLSTTHLSDHVSNCALLWESLREGDVISNAVCISRNKQVITLSKKPLIRQALEEGAVARDFSEVTMGMQQAGWIRSIMPYGVFVEFPHGLVGLAPTAVLCDKFISDPTTAFRLGQTVYAKVTNLDEEKRRFLVSLKSSEIVCLEEDARSRLIQGLQERRAADEMMALRDESERGRILIDLSIGEKLKLTVDSANDDSGATFKSDDLPGVSVLASKQHVKGVSLTEGQKVTARVLHVDVGSACVQVSVLPELVAKKKSLSEGAAYTATVQHLDPDFAVVSLGDSSQLAVMHSRSHLNHVVASESDRLTEGAAFRAVLLESSCEEAGGLPLALWGCSRPQTQRSAPDSRPDCSGSGHRFGDTVHGTVRSVKPTAVLVTLEGGGSASVHVSEVVDPGRLRIGSFPTSTLRVGSSVRGRVIGGRDMSGHRFLPFSHPKYTYTIPELTLIPSKLDESESLKPVHVKEKLGSYKEGDEITCFVSKFDVNRKSLEVAICPGITGTVELLGMITDPKQANRPEKLHKLGQAIRARVVGVNAKARNSLMLSLTGVHRLEAGACTLGIVTGVVPQVGLLVKLPFGAGGTACITDLTDSYKPKPLESFSNGQLIRCFLLGEEKEKWQLSLRLSRLEPGKVTAVSDPELTSLDHLKAGQRVRGYVKCVKEEGVFIRLSCSITGRAQLQRTTTYFLSSHSVLSEHLPPGTLLTAKILSIDREAGFVNLSLLPADTGKKDVLPESLGLTLRLTGKEKKKHDLKQKRKRSLNDAESQTPAKKKKKDKKKAKGDADDSGVEVFFREEEDEEEGEEKPTCSKVSSSSSRVDPPRLQVEAGFSWDEGLSALRPAPPAQASDGEEERTDPKPAKKSRQELRAEKKAEERALVRREAELMDPGLTPQDPAAFERLLLGSPSSSLLWLQYMAHHLQATQIEQARAVAERALKTISFREEQEKLNVWVALLNLENMYGTRESLKKVFERAVQFCEPMPVFQQLADIYASSDKPKEAESLYKTMVKRFRQERAVWLSYGAFLMQQGQRDAAGALLQRALKSLPAKDSVDVIAKFAQLEFRYGDPETGRSMMDKVLTSYPRRTDLWSVFIDLMVKHGSQKEVRALFDRVIHLSVPVKKIKFFFKRYLEYEKKHGDAQSVQAVKDKAVEFVEAKGAGAGAEA